VLAIDADLRRPTIHQHFGLGKTPGLSDLIVGKCRPSEAIHKTQFPGLQVMPCGYVPPNPTELLGSASLREILAALKTHYDWILIDTPPVLAMADTAVLCPLVDGMALVVGAEQSTRPAVMRAIDQIRSVNGHMLGVILNKVDFERNSYYYGQYYGEYYRSYYAEKHEEPKVAPRPIRRV
jgi:capsular exopolysaccharide synthesis family protein